MQVTFSEMSGHYAQRWAMIAKYQAAIKYKPLSFVCLFVLFYAFFQKYFSHIGG
jgi:hypothetical protein